MNTLYAEVLGESVGESPVRDQGGVEEKVGAVQGEGGETEQPLTGKQRLMAVLLKRRQEALADKERVRLAAESMEHDCELDQLVVKDSLSSILFPSRWNRNLFVDTRATECFDVVIDLIYDRYADCITHKIDDEIRAQVHLFCKGGLTPLEMFDAVEMIVAGEKVEPKAPKDIMILAAQLGQDLGEAVTIKEYDARHEDNAAMYGLKPVSIDEYEPEWFVYASTIRHLEKLRKQGYTKFVTRRAEVASLLTYVEDFWSQWFFCSESLSDVIPLSRAARCKGGFVGAAQVGRFLSLNQTQIHKQTQPVQLGQYMHVVMSNDLFVETPKYQTPEMGRAMRPVDQMLQDKSRLRYTLDGVVASLWRYVVALDESKVGKLNAIHGYMRRIQEELVYHPTTKQFLRPSACVELMLSNTSMGRRMRVHFESGSTAVEAFIAADRRENDGKRSHTARYYRGPPSRRTLVESEA